MAGSYTQDRKANIRAKLLEYRILKITRLLECFGVKCDKEVRFDEATGSPYLKCRVNSEKLMFPFRFPLTKLGRRFERELQRLDRACYCGTVRLEDVQALLLALSTPKFIYKYRSWLRRATGLVKDKKLQNYLISRRIRITKLQKERLK